MGEEVDLSQFDAVEEKTAPAKKKLDEELVKNALDQLRLGKSRTIIINRLHGMGHTYEDAERIVSQAEHIHFEKKESKVNFPLVLGGLLAAVIVLVLLGYFAFNIFSVTTDCGEDSFCTQKIISCAEGSYTSTFRGLTNEYTIEQEDSFCSVFVKAVASTQQEINPGMTMSCLYPFANGTSDMTGGYSNCDGSLADALSP